LRDQEGEFHKRNVKIVVVSFEAGFLARGYVEETSLAWPLLVDDTRETYRNYGMLTASFWDVWGPKTLWVYLKEILKGRKLKKSEGDVYQRGGDVLIDPGGTVRLHYVGASPADRPTVEALLDRIDSMQ
jgi:peroxiredoxin